MLSSVVVVDVGGTYRKFYSLFIRSSFANRPPTHTHTYTYLSHNLSFAVGNGYAVCTCRFAVKESFSCDARMRSCCSCKTQRNLFMLHFIWSGTEFLVYSSVCTLHMNQIHLTPFIILYTQCTLNIYGHISILSTSSHRRMRYINGEKSVLFDKNISR